MPFFLINPSDISNNRALIKGDEAHHIQRVLRLGVGDKLTMIDGVGNKYDARIIQQDAHQVIAELLSKSLVIANSFEITLVQCLPRLDKMDLIVQKAVELGVARIVPVISERCRAVQTDRLKSKQKRWQRIAEEAAKQCGQAYVPTVDVIQKLSVLLENNREDIISIVLWEEEGTTTLKQVLHEKMASDRLALLVGPEGGFFPQEIELMRAKNWRPVSLGPRILRLETAAIVGLGIIQYELGDLS